MKITHYKFDNMKNFFITALYVTLSLSFLVLTQQVVSAAELVMRGSSSEVGSNGEVAVELFLNTGNEEINAVEGTVVLPPELKVKEIRDGNSLITFWVKRPDASLATSERLAFSGLTPGGISVTNGYLFTILFQTQALNEAKTVTVGLDTMRVLLNDGAGTPTSVTAKSLTLRLNPNVKSTTTVSEFPTDTNPPEPFTPVVGRDQYIGGGDWFVAFLAQDKGSGIDYYENQETKETQMDENAWKKATSPYILTDQTREGYIYVKAIDKAGNVRVQEVSPAGTPGMEYTKYVILCILLIVSLFFGILVWRKRKNAPSSFR